VTVRHQNGATLLGALDDDWLLLIPDATYQFVVGAARAEGGAFPVGKEILLRRLDEAGLIATEPSTGRRTPKVSVGGYPQRRLKLMRSALDPVSASDTGETGGNGDGQARDGTSRGQNAGKGNGKAGEGGTDRGEADTPDDPSASLLTQPSLLSNPPIPPFPPSDLGNEGNDEEVIEWRA
jgi:hypothetical protein